MIVDDIVKNYVGAVCKSAEYKEVLVADDTVIVNIADTALAIVPINYSTGVYQAINVDDIKKGFSGPQNTDMINKIQNYRVFYDNCRMILPVVATYEDLRSDEAYEELLARKATDGAGFYQIHGNNLYENYLLPVFSGFPNLSKPDKVGIVVRRIDQNTLLMQYHIYKKKINKEYDLYFRTLDMNRPLIPWQH